jgi:hypothetical protein
MDFQFRKNLIVFKNRLKTRSFYLSSIIVLMVILAFALGVALVRYNPNDLRASISEQAENIERGLFSINEGNQDDADEIDEFDEPITSLLQDSEPSNVYRERAGDGEGLTHLARRAINGYLEESNQNISAEKKIYMEDYVQRRIDLSQPDGSRWLEVGQEVEISQELISEAMSMAENLTTEEIANLSYYAALVF